MLVTASARRFNDSQSVCNSGHILPAAGPPAEHPNFSDTPRGIFATHLILEERVPDIFRHSRHCQNVALTFLISLGTDAIVERDAIIPDQPESARKELAHSWARVDPDHLLEQLRPLCVLAVTPESIVTAL